MLQTSYPWHASQNIPHIRSCFLKKPGSQIEPEEHVLSTNAAMYMCFSCTGIAVKLAQLVYVITGFPCAFTATMEDTHLGADRDLRTADLASMMHQRSSSRTHGGTLFFAQFITLHLAVIS